MRLWNTELIIIKICAWISGCSFFSPINSCFWSYFVLKWLCLGKHWQESGKAEAYLVNVTGTPTRWPGSAPSQTGHMVQLARFVLESLWLRYQPWSLPSSSIIHNLLAMAYGRETSEKKMWFLPLKAHSPMEEGGISADDCNARSQAWGQKGWWEMSESVYSSTKSSSRSQRSCSVKRQVVNCLGFGGCTVSVTTAQLCHCNRKADTDNNKQWVWLCSNNKTMFMKASKIWQQKKKTRWICPVGHSLRTFILKGNDNNK